MDFLSDLFPQTMHLTGHVTGTPVRKSSNCGQHKINGAVSVSAII
jgi:hypothetical protein